MYVINSLKLKRGDIILVRYPGDELSQKIMKKTNSNYSHAMLYVDLDSIIEAGEIVTANNPIRETIENLEDACVLRLKPEYWDESLIDAAIGYARQKIGMQYSLREACNVINPPQTVEQPNRQICTRLVARAFQEAGLSIVDNPDQESLFSFVTYIGHHLYYITTPIHSHSKVYISIFHQFFLLFYPNKRKLCDLS